MFKPCSGTFKQSFTVCWCHVEDCYQAITSKCSIYIFTLSRHVLYVLVLVLLLVFTILVQPLLRSQHFSGSSSVFRKPQWGFFRCFCGIHICSFGVLHLWYIWFCHQCILHNLHYSDLYLFLAAPFCCSVFWGTVAWLHTSYFVRPCFVGWPAVGYSVFYSVM